ncbi:hypothetical protein [Maridesulfovibrio sp.]|uniref:hypothetical protein n=1 Tax=Maridesulfovibrio sp. TaxID=2795000 RepID=UPI0029C9BE19|nr:hypothetical protein [Maridesulfovibrio sp.]
MKNLILAAVATTTLTLAAPLMAGAGECDLIGNNDLRHMCKGETILIDKRDLRLVSSGDCDLVKDNDWRNVCYGRADLVRDPDRRHLAEGDCILIKVRDLRMLCRGWKR